MNDERFRGVGTTWSFWVISDDYGDYANIRMKNSGVANGKNGKIYEADNASIWVKTWAQVLDENRARMQFFQEHLEYEADKGASLQHLQEHYAKFLQGVVVEDGSEAGEGRQKARIRRGCRSLDENAFDLVERNLVIAPVVRPMARNVWPPICFP